MALLVLVIEDEERIAFQRREELARVGIRSYVVPSFIRAVEALQSWTFDALVVNASALGARGLDLLAHLRGHHASSMLVLVDGCDERQQIAALASGATDVMDACASSELVAAKLSRLLEARPQTARPAPSPARTVGSLALDERAGLASVDSMTLELTPYQFRLISLLASRTGEVVSREEVVQILMGTSDIRVVDVQVSRIRKKLKGMNVDDVALRTVRGRGYSLVANPRAHR